MIKLWYQETVIDRKQSWEGSEAWIYCPRVPPETPAPLPWLLVEFPTSIPALSGTHGHLQAGGQCPQWIWHGLLLGAPPAQPRPGVPRAGAGQALVAPARRGVSRGCPDGSVLQPVAPAGPAVPVPRPPLQPMGGTGEPAQGPAQPLRPLQDYQLSSQKPLAQEAVWVASGTGACQQ